MDLNIHQMFYVYTKEIRSILEMAVSVWHSGLSNQQTADIESIQKVAMRIILQNKYTNYQLAYGTLTAQTLAEQRITLCTKFSVKI